MPSGGGLLQQEDGAHDQGGIDCTHGISAGAHLHGLLAVAPSTGPQGLLMGALTTR
jgi:hypothetical protein